MGTFESFAQGPVAAWADGFAGREVVWIFHHIPKTAGSSLTRELSTTLAPYRNIHVRPEATPTPGARPRLELMMDEVEAFVADHRRRPYASASGHLRLPHLRRIVEAVPGATLFTFLRDPAARLVSDYRYAKTPKHPPHQDFARRYPTIEAYLDDPTHQNKMWRFVRQRNAPADAAALGQAFRAYAFFGLVSDLSLHFEFLTALTTRPRRPEAKVNVTEGRADNAVELSPELRRRIETLNGEDYALYAAVERAVAEKRAEMAAFVAERRAFFAGAAA